jgi:hypothetical protein
LHKTYAKEKYETIALNISKEITNKYEEQLSATKIKIDKDFGDLYKKVESAFNKEGN